MVVFGSCNWLDPEEEQPGYIYIPELGFQATVGQGTSSHNITEVWVYANDQMLGAYDLPATVPVLLNGATDIRIFGGIKNNGISSTRIKYPFYSSFDTTLNIQPLVYDTVIPQIRYYDDLEFQPFDFEAGIPYEPYSTSDVGMNSVTDEALVFEGNASAFATLNSTQDQIIVRSLDQWQWNEGETVFLEMNYSCNNSFSVGLVVHSGATVSRHFALVLNPSTSSLGIPAWRKVYVDLGFLILNHPDGDFYELYFESVKDDENSTVELYLDNLKIVEFQD